MRERYDVVIIGGSMAGVSAALTCRNRGKSTAVIANSAETSSLYKAETISNYPGVFAAGDCTGKPYQLAKAAGEGNIAALSACAYIDKKKKEK